MSSGGPEREQSNPPAIERLKELFGLSGVESQSSIKKHIDLAESAHIGIVYESSDKEKEERLDIGLYKLESGIEFTITMDGLKNIVFRDSKFLLGKEGCVTVSLLRIDSDNFHGEAKNEFNELADSLSGWLEQVVNENRISEIPLNFSFL